MSRVTEAGLDGAQQDIQRTEQRAVGEREVRWTSPSTAPSIPASVTLDMLTSWV